MSERSRSVVIHRIWMMLPVLAVGVLYFLIRIQNTDTLITNDEPFWLGRSANFFRAIVHWEPEFTYQMAHPGVPVMWMGAIAYWLHGADYAAHFDTNLEWPFAIDDRLVAAGIDPMQMLQDARVIKLGFETLPFMVSVLLTAVIASRFVAVLAGLLITLDPFLAGSVRCYTSTACWRCPCLPRRWGLCGLGGLRRNDTFRGPSPVESRQSLC